MDDKFGYQFVVENVTSFMLPMVGDYIDLDQRASKRVVQRDFQYSERNGASQVEITLFVE